MIRRLIILCGVLALSLGLRVWLAASPATPLRSPLAVFPRALGSWETLREHTMDQDVLAVLQADEYLLRTYRNPRGQILDLYVGYYENQRTGETMHSPKNCLPGSGWQPVSNDRIAISSAARRGAGKINRYLVEKDGQRVLVLYWYQAHGKIIASEYWGKIYLVRDSIWRQRRDGALIRLVIPVEDGLEDAESRALEFVRLLLPELPHFLPD